MVGIRKHAPNNVAAVKTMDIALAKQVAEKLMAHDALVLMHVMN
jgi:hypothetical protein